MRIPAAIIVTLCVIVEICAQLTNENPLEYSENEILAIQKFRTRVEDALYADYMKTDAFLIRWLRDRKFDMDKANNKLRKALEWRKRTGVDTMFQDPVFQKLNKSCPVEYSGYDRTGRPVVTMAWGACRVRKLVLSGLGSQRLARHIQASLELGLIRISERLKQGFNATQMVFLNNMAGFSSREHLCLACIPIYTEMASIFEEYYPGILKALVVINAPRLFQTVIQVVKPIVSPETLGRIHAIGSNKAEWQKTILDLISPDQLIPQYGGIRTVA